MKKSQRARLATLTATAETSRSPEDKAEFTYLSTLATMHPDAAKDVDDTSPAGAAAAAAPAAVTASPAAGANAPPPAAAAAPITLLGMLTSLRGTAAVGSDLVTARQTITTLTGERDTARTGLTAAQTALTAAQAQLAVFAEFFGLKATELAGKDRAALATLLEQKVSSATIEQLAALGTPPAALPKSAASVATADSKTLTYAEFSALTPADKMKFSANGGRLTD